MRYKEYIEELKRSPKKYVDIIKLEYVEVRKDIRHLTTLALATATITITLIKLAPWTAKWMSVFLSCFLTLYTLLLHEEETNLRELRRLLIESNCVVTMGLRDELELLFENRLNLFAFTLLLLALIAAILTTLGVI